MVCWSFGAKWQIQINMMKNMQKWNLSDLPIIPSEYKYEVSKSTKKQFNILKKLMNEKDIDTIINACDAGREGESIFRLVYQMTGSKKEYAKIMDFFNGR